MRNINAIAAEIVELNTIKSAYHHFLASYDGQQQVENATLVKANKLVVSENLKKLYEELAEAKKAEGKRDEALAKREKVSGISQKPKAGSYFPASASAKPVTELRMKFKQYEYTELESRAIMLFNSDKRYTITE